MATITNAKSRRLYSWWWDSHISPKNSKWLQENLADIDVKVKIMIKLIEHDAESFAQRAEMFYKNRPELMKLVEEFYRAYRALAERYDHATGALRQAHRKMAEAFPNEISLEFFDEPSPGSSTDVEAHRLGMPDEDRLQHEHLRASGHDVTETHSKEADSSSGENAMNQLDHMFKGKCSSVKEEEEKCSEYKLLQKEIARLSKENEDLKSQIALELTRADKAEYEVNHLKEVSSRIKTEKVNALSQCEESKTRVASLENEISCMQADLKKLNDEMVRGAKFLNHAKVRSLSLEKANQALTSELDRLKQRIREQESELKIKEEELDQLSASLKVECQDRKKDDLACHSIEKRLAECQEEMRCLMMEIRSSGEKMKDVQMSKASLEEELIKIREKNDKLNEEKLLSALKIINMQDEIISLRCLNEKLHDELNHRIKEKTALQQELHHLKEDRNDLEKRYHALKEEVHVVNLNIQFLQAMIKELRDENFELKETIKKHEDEKQAHLHTLKHMEMVSNKNAILEVSISDANNELGRLRDRIKTLEDSCYHLHGRISINQAEKALLVSHVEAFSKNMEKVSRENTFLENSLFDMNAELDGLRGRLKDMEESCQYLCDEKSTLLYEKAALTSQIESIRQSLKNLESRYATLEGKQARLEKEKGSTLQQVEELQELLRLEREEHSSLIKSSNSQLRTLVKQIRLLQVEGRQRQEELELEQLNIMNSQIEIFVLQRCLRDMREGNINLSAETQKHQDSLRCTEKLISHLGQECHIQEEKIVSLTEHNEKLKEWIHLIIKLLKIDLEKVPLDHIKDEVLLQLILHEIRQIQRTTSEIQDENQHLLLEKSVILTLLEKFGAYVADLRAEKAALEREAKIKIDDYAVLKSENDKLFIMNEQLRGEVQASNKREEALKAEVDIIFGELSDLQKEHCSLQIAVSNMSEENRSISEKLLQLSENKEKLEMENTIILADVVALDCLALVLKSCITEKGTELKILSDGRNYLHEVQKDLDEEIKVINENIVMLHAKITRSKESIPKLENHEGLIEFQNEISNVNFFSTSAGVLFTENMVLSEANSTLQSVQGGDTDLCGNNCAPKLDCMFKMDKEQMEKHSYKETGTGYLDKKNEVLKEELIGLHAEAEELRRRERYLTSALQNEKDKQKHSNVEISSALVDIQLVEIDAKLFKIKVHEIIKAFHAFETSSMIQMKILQEEITKRDFTIEELEEKLNALESENRGIMAELKAFLLLVRSLCDDISHPEEYSMSQDVKFKSSNKSSPQPTAGHGGTAMPGVLKLKDLHSKIEVLEKVMMEAGYFLELERLESAASLNSTWKEITGLTSSGISLSESSNVKCEQIARDVQLDIVVNSSRCSNTDLSDIWDTTNANEVVDQVSESELHLTSEVSCSYQKLKTTLVIPDDDETTQQIEIENGRYPLLELVVEKELGVDKLVLPKKLETQKQWNRRVIQRLSSDGHRLLVLHACVKELQKNIEASEKNNHSSKSELNPVKAQLKGAEGTISKLIESNSKLAKKVENLSASPAEEFIEKKGDGIKSQKQITDQARKVSEKIGRLELEMQKIQFTLLKTEEECAGNRAKGVDKSAGVILKEYIYGRRDSRRQKKGSSCGCMRPKAESDE